MKVGQLTYGILDKLSKQGAKSQLNKPTLLLATLFIEVYGDIKISAPGSCLEAK